MFTGLIEEVSKIKDIKITDKGAKIFFSASFNDIKEGDSIALNGACLTVTPIGNDLFCADVMNETLNLTNLSKLKKGDLINLERALQIKDRLAGHIVLGHVDCIACVCDIKNDGFSKRIKFSCDTDLIIQKGSIAINGVSLTVANLYNEGFEVSLIPETTDKTNLKNLKIGDTVNIEYDVLGKYIKKFTQSKKEKITLDFLKENGF